MTLPAAVANLGSHFVKNPLTKIILVDNFCKNIISQKRVLLI